MHRTVLKPDNDTMLAQVRSTGERLAAATAGGLRILSVDAVAVGTPRDARARIVFETLDDALLPTRQFVEVAGCRGLAGLLRPAAVAGARRTRLLARLTKRDGVALVDELVEAAVMHSGSTVGAVVSWLRDGPEKVVTLAPEGSPVVKAWMIDGRLACSFELSRELRWNSTRLLVRLPLFAVAQSSLVRRSVSAIADHPMLPTRIRIAACHPAGSENEFTLRTALRVVTQGELDSSQGVGLKS